MKRLLLGLAGAVLLGAALASSGTKPPRPELEFRREKLNPVTHLVTAVRGLMAGTATAGHIGYVLAACAVLTAVFAPLSLRLYRGK